MNISSNQSPDKGQEPPMYLQRPSSAHSQDVRHILARAFRDLYTADPISHDMFKNLQASRGSDDSYHEQYVENLQKVYTEWQRRMDEIAMLERHIMQAQARAMTADERELNKASMACENYKELGLPPVRSHFRSCIDTQLLRDHNLLTPSDYLVPDPLPLPSSKDCKIPIYATETVAIHQHNRPDKIKPKTSPRHEPSKKVEFSSVQSDGEVEDGTGKEKKKKEQAIFPKKNGWKEFLSEEQRETDKKYLNMLQAKTNYMQNPRFISYPTPANGRPMLTALDKKPKLLSGKIELQNAEANLIIFVPEPSVVEFTNYKVGEVYEITLELKNMSTVMRQCRVLPPSTNVFSVGLGQFPGDSGLVAPGLGCKYNIRFTPHSLRNYDDFITVEMQAAYPLVIPLKARRPIPVFTLPGEIDIGSCLINGIQAIQLLVKNEGGQGRFCLMPRNKWPTASIRSVLPNVMKTTIKSAPFEIHPAMFELNQGQSIALEVLFNPTHEKTYIQDITIACDNCNISHFKLKGKGETAKVILDDVELGLSEPMLGEFIDVSTTNLVRFEDLNPFTYTERIAKISNCTNTELRYQWMVYKTILVSCFSNDQRDITTEEERVADLHSAFSVLPSNGVLQPLQTAEFRLIFAPSVEGNFHSVAHMVLQNVPAHKTGMSVCRRMTYDAEGQPKDDFSIFDVVGSLPFKEVSSIGVDMKGKCVPLNVILHPYALIIQTQVLKGSTIRRLFTMANHSYSCIIFRWEPFTESYIIEIEPPFGELDPGMAMDFEIRVTGFQPGKINHTMLCHIMNMAEPLHLLVQAEFKGPELRIDEPSINFGLIRVGQCEIREMTIVNTSEICVKFAISDCPMDPEYDSVDQDVPSILKISETSGELQPFGRKTVTLTLIPTCAESFRRMCHVHYEDQSCSVGLYGEAQNPVVCFLECQKFLPDVYLNIPAVFTVVLHNQTLLPTTFKWGAVEGSQAKFCKIEVLEEEGELQSWQQKTLSIAFTPLEAVSFSDVRLPCHITGQDDDIYINISCDVKTLNVSYKVSTDGHQLTNTLELDFGNAVPLGEIVKRYFHIYNQTAISASFSAYVGHFTAPFECLEVKNAKTGVSQQHGLLSRTSNIDAFLNKSAVQMAQDYNKQVLSKNAGIAFVVCPSQGELKPFGTQIIEISAHSDIWGYYTDMFICKVGKLKSVRVPIICEIIGCPLSLQMTAGLPGLKAIVRFGSHVAGTSVTRKLKINNPSPIDIRVDWQIFKKVDVPNKVIDFVTYFGIPFPIRDSFGTELNTYISGTESIKQEYTSEQVLSSIEGEEPVDNVENIHFSTEMSIAKVKTSETITVKDSYSTTNSLTLSENPQIVFCSFQPHNGIRITEPFSLKPSQMIIQAKGSITVDFTFNPKDYVSEEVDFIGYALGFLSLVNEPSHSDHVYRPETYDAEQLHFSYSAHLSPTLLTVEEVEEDGMRFMAAISDIMKENEIQSEVLQMHSIKLTNHTKTPLTFKLKVLEPFLLMGFDPSCNHKACLRTMKTVSHTLQPQQFLMSKVAFRISVSLLPDTSKQSRESLSALDRKLIFENELIIRFINGAKQRVPLYATLTIPQMEVSEEFLDFGLCLVGQTRELVFDIFNTSSSHCYWRISIDSKSDTCDDDTFKIQPEKGMLEAFIAHVSKSKVTVKVLFTAKHSDLYDCTYLVQGLLGEYPCRIVVVGQGSYDGKNEAILDI